LPYIGRVAQEAEPGISLVFILSSNRWDICLMAGICMIKNGERVVYENEILLNKLRESYGIEEKKPTKLHLCYEFIQFGVELINLRNFNSNYNNYYKLFDEKEMFDIIIDSTVEQAQLLINRLGENREVNQWL